MVLFGVMLPGIDDLMEKSTGRLRPTFVEQKKVRQLSAYRRYNNPNTGGNSGATELL